MAREPRGTFLIDARPRSVEELGIERKPFYTPGEVAKILDISDQKVLDRIHAPIDDPFHIYAVVVGPRLYRIPFGALLQLLGITPQVRVSDRPNLIADGIRDELPTAPRSENVRRKKPVR